MDRCGFGYYFSKEQIEADFACITVLVATESKRRQGSSRRATIVAYAENAGPDDISTDITDDCEMQDMQIVSQNQ